MPRRLAALATTVALAVGAPAAGDPAGPSLDEVTAAGEHWRFQTARGPIHVWVPAGYHAPTAAVVVFVHGYHLELDEVWTVCRLAEQFALSGRNAMFIAAAAPSARQGDIVWPGPTALLAAVAAHTDVAMPVHRVVAIGHSGAYRTLAAWLSDARLDTVILLDAVYGELRFAPWLAAAPHRRLINIASDTGRSSDALHRRLPGTHYVDGLSASELPEGRIVYARTELGHWELLAGGVALPLALRAIGVGQVAAAPGHLPLGFLGPGSEHQRVGGERGRRRHTEHHDVADRAGRPGLPGRSRR